MRHVLRLCTVLLIAAHSMVWSAALTALEPVLLVPALGASVLDAKLVNATPFKTCARDWERYRIYASEKEFTIQLFCFFENIKQKLDAATNCTRQDRDGVAITPHDWGGVDGITTLNPGDVYEVKQFNDMVMKLEQLGYVAGTSLRGAPYDFRLHGESCFFTRYNAELHSLIEETSQLNGARPVRLVCHSMGCNAVVAFLRASASAWKETYVAGLVVLAGPLGGAPSVVQTVITGKLDPIVPTWPSEYVRQTTGTWPSLLSLLPHQMPGLGDVYNDSVLVYTPTRNYTVSKMHKLVDDLSTGGLYQTKYPQTFGTAASPFANHLYPFISEELFAKSGVHPGVDLDCVYLTDVETSYELTFSKADLSDGGRYTSTRMGDGTVPLNSIELPCRRWAAQESSWRVTNHPFPSKGGKYVHMNIISHPDVIELVASIVQNATGMY